MIAWIATEEKKEKLCSVEQEIVGYHPEELLDWGKLVSSRLTQVQRKLAPVPFQP